MRAEASAGVAWRTLAQAGIHFIIASEPGVMTVHGSTSWMRCHELRSANIRDSSSLCHDSQCPACYDSGYTAGGRFRVKKIEDRKLTLARRCRFGGNKLPQVGAFGFGKVDGKVLIITQPYPCSISTSKSRVMRY